LSNATNAFLSNANLWENASSTSCFICIKQIVSKTITNKCKQVISDNDTPETQLPTNAVNIMQCIFGSDRFLGTVPKKRSELYSSFVFGRPLEVTVHSVLRFCLSVCLSVLCVFLSVTCLSMAVYPHYCTDPDVIWGSGRECPLVVHYWADLQSVHCYGNTMEMRGRAQR